MAKGGSSRKRENKNPSRHKSNGSKLDATNNEDFDDEIDAFHKQRDIVPLDVDDDVEGSDEDDELPVFDFKGANVDEDDDEDEDDEDDDDEDDTQLTGVAAKIARKQKDLWAKNRGVEDEMHEATDDEEDKGTVWGKRKRNYYGADNVNSELQSSDEDPALEEADALRLQKEKAKLLSMEDFGLDDVSEDESDGEPTLEEIRSKDATAQKAPSELDIHNDLGVAYEVVKKDLNALTKEEQMDVVYSSAPELVGLLSELNDAVAELENKIDPLLSKVKNMGSTARGGLHYLEIKQQLLLAYCQAITFYLLLKSEGQPVRDHPVIARLVEIKNLLDKMKQLDGNLPSELEDILMKQQHVESVMKLPKDDVTLTSVSSMNGHTVSNRIPEVAAPHEAAEVVKVDDSQNIEKKRRKIKDMDEYVGVQSREMLKVRASLEEKLKQKGLFSSVTSKHEKGKNNQQLLNGQLVTLADFDDDATVKNKGDATTHRPSKLSQLVIPRIKKPKIISGDDDVPMRDDIGERRRKHELRVLAGAGIKVTDADNGNEDGDEPENFESDEDTDMEDGGEPESEDEFYKQVKQQRAEKLAAKAELYSGTPAIASVLEETAEDGKRHISYQMEKNRGLTRPRKKLIKNPRKKYKLKHQKAVVARRGQVRDVKKPMGSYGGETSGINAGISRSIRF